MAKIYAVQSCMRCLRNFQPCGQNDSYCTVCASIIEAEKEEKEYQEWRGSLTVEQRLEKVERWILKHRKNHPQNPQMYA